MKKHFLSIILLGIFVGIFCALLFFFGFFSGWRAKLTDKLFLPGKSSEEIVIVAIDNASLSAIGRWPWDRKRHAELIQKINEAKPLVIGVDINFPESSDPESDRILAESIKEAVNVVLPIEASLITEKGELFAKELLRPIASLEKSALSLGLTNTPPDTDGVFRVLPLEISDRDQVEYKHFTKVIADYYVSKKDIIANFDSLPANNQLRVNYQGKPGTFSTVSAVDVLAGRISQAELAGKIVLIGATAPDLHDEQMTPVSRGVPMSGVEVLANGIETIITQNYLEKEDTWQMVILIIFVAVLCAISVTFLKIGWATLTVFLGMIVYLIFSLLMFNRGKIFDIFFVLIAMLLAYLGSVVARYYFETKEKKYIKNVFSYYVSKDIINDLLANPEKIKLGGEEREMTILFSDIRGFTTISEKLSPKDLVALLNDYLTAMSNLIMKSQGVVDKYIGDAIMAFWGAPLENKKHATMACQSALAMVKCLGEKRTEWQKSFGVDLNIGIGLNTGQVVVGNMGSEQRFDYTVMGDAVNLASRLESITKQYGVRIVASEFTYEQTKDIFVWRYLDKVAVKGKKTGVKIYELIGEPAYLDQTAKKLLGAFAVAMDYYEKCQWNEMALELEKILSEFPDDSPSQVYLERAREFIKNPPPEDWDGIYIMKTK